MVDYLVWNEKTFELKVKLQLNPIKEVGLNGVQIDDVIIFVREFITKRNNEFPCRENSIVITKLEEAEMWLERRKRDRVERGVEGFNKK